MKIFFLLFLISVSSWSAEVKLKIDKESVYTGEIVSAEVENYRGSEITEKKLDDVLYIVSMNSLQAEVVFLKKPTVNTLLLNDGDYLVWNPINVQELKIPSEAILSDFTLSLKNNKLALVTTLGLFLVIFIIVIFFKKVSPQLKLKRERRVIKDELFSASSFNEITNIWKNKYRYIESFPFIEDDFNQFEVIFYKHAFKKIISDEERKEIIQGYMNFLAKVRGGRYGV